MARHISSLLCCWLLLYGLIPLDIGFSVQAQTDAGEAPIEVDNGSNQPEDKPPEAPAEVQPERFGFRLFAKPGETGTAKEEPRIEEQKPEPEKKAPMPYSTPAAMDVEVSKKNQDVAALREQKQQLHDAVVNHPRYDDFQNFMEAKKQLTEARRGVASDCAAGAESCGKYRTLLTQFEGQVESKQTEMRKVFGELVDRHHLVSVDLSRMENQRQILKEFQKSMAGCGGGAEGIHRCMQKAWDGASPNSENLQEAVLFEYYDRERHPDFSPEVGGVDISFNKVSFAQAFQFAQNARQTPVDFADEWDRIYLDQIPHETVNNLVAVSMDALTKEASKYSQQWEALPDHLRYPGHMTRLRGIVFDPRTYNVVLIGQTGEDKSSYLAIDDLIVAFQAVIRKDEDPAVSIDPDPDDPTLPHKSRVMGIPKDSEFSKVLLDADYTMKQVISESMTLPIPDLTQTIRQKFEVLNELVSTMGSLSSRFWLCPVQPFPGSMMATSDGTTVIFQNGVQVLTEEETKTQKGFTGKGKTLEPH